MRLSAQSDSCVPTVVTEQVVCLAVPQTLSVKSFGVLVWSQMTTHPKRLLLQLRNGTHGSLSQTRRHPTNFSMERDSRKTEVWQGSELPHLIQADVTPKKK